MRRAVHGRRARVPTGAEPGNRQASARAGDHHRHGGGRLAQRDRRAGGLRQAGGAGARDVVGAVGGGRLGAAGAPEQPPHREREQRRDLRRDAARPDQGLIDPGHQSGMPAELTMGEMAGEAATVAKPERGRRAQPPALDGGLDLLAALATGELLVLLAELSTRPEQAALDHLAGHVQARADLVVGQALELTHHQQLVMARGQAAEGAAQVIQPLLALDGGRRRGHGRERGVLADPPRTRRRTPAAPRARGCRGETRRCTRSWRSRRATA